MNKNIIITSDSSCDLPISIIEKYNIQICPISVLIGENEYFDTINITSEQVLEKVKETNCTPKTSAISCNRYTEFFEQFTSQGKTVLHFNISSKASCCNQNANLASMENKNVHVVDSLNLSSGQGLLMLMAIDLLQEGNSIEQVLESIDKFNEKIQMSFIIDSLDFLQKGGRCSSASAIASKILKIHPSIHMVDGELKVKSKYMGKLQVCINKYLNDTLKDFPNYNHKRAIIVYSPSNQADIDLFKNKVNQLFKFDEILEVVASSTITSHCGFGTLGLIFEK